MVPVQLRAVVAEEWLRSVKQSLELGPLSMVTPSRDNRPTCLSDSFPSMRRGPRGANARDGGSIKRVTRSSIFVRVKASFVLVLV